MTTPASSGMAAKKNKTLGILIVDPVTEWKQVVDAAHEEGYVCIVVQLSPIEDRMKNFFPTPRTLQAAGVEHILQSSTSSTIGHGDDYFDVALQPFEPPRDVFACVYALKLLEEAQDLSIQGVVPLSETAVDLSDVLASMLGLSHHNPLPLTLCRRDKGFMKEAVEQSGLRVARFARMTASNRDIRFHMEQLGLNFPVVIKQPQGFSTTHVYICHTLEDAEQATTTIQKSEGPYGRRVEQVLMEEYIGGTEFAVNLMAFSKRMENLDATVKGSTTSEMVVTDVWKYDKSNTARYSSAEICDPNDPALKDIVSYAIGVARAVGIRYGAGHVEVKAHKGGVIDLPPNIGDERHRHYQSHYYSNPVMMEVGARLSGGRKASMTREALKRDGVAHWNPFRALVQSHCGQQPTWCDSYTPIHFVRHVFLPIERSGRVHHVAFPCTTSNDEPSVVPTLHSHVLLVQEGDLVKETTDITSSAGFVWLVGERTQVDKDAMYILSKFKLDVVDG